MTAWVPISDDWPGYEIDLCDGTVRSVDRVIVETTGKQRHLRGVTLAQVRGRQEQPQVTLSRGGYRRSYRVADLLDQARRRSIGEAIAS